MTPRQIRRVRRGQRSRGRDRGSATLWAVGLLALVMVAVAVATVTGAAVLARHRAGAAADLGALAAASRVAAGTDTACAQARQVVTANHATLAGCTCQGMECVVGARVEVEPVLAVVEPGTAATVWSRAGPADAPALGDPVHPAAARAPPVRAAPAPRGWRGS